MMVAKNAQRLLMKTMASKFENGWQPLPRIRMAPRAVRFANFPTSVLHLPSEAKDTLELRVLSFHAAPCSAPRPNLVEPPVA